jgi:hypothetical protein
MLQRSVLALPPAAQSVQATVPLRLLLRPLALLRKH